MPWRHSEESNSESLNVIIQKSRPWIWFMILCKYSIIWLYDVYSMKKFLRIKNTLVIQQFLYPTLIKMMDWYALLLWYWLLQNGFCNILFDNDPPFLPMFFHMFLEQTETWKRSKTWILLRKEKTARLCQAQLANLWQTWLE